MVIFEDVTLRNFLPIGNVTQAVTLNQEALTLILGENSDATGGTSRNGAGKTTILQGISFVAYGVPLSRIKVDNLINNINHKGMMGTLGLSRDGVRYRIERGRKPNILKFYQVDGDNLIDLSQGENSETQKLIDAVIGMGHTMFKHIVALNTYTIPFLQMRPAEQREVIEELIGATQISMRAESLKKLVSATKDGIKVEEASIKATIAANDRIQEAIERATRQREAWVSDNQRKVAVLEEQLATIDAIDFDKALADMDAYDAFMEASRACSQRITDADRELSLHKRELSSKEAEIARARRSAGQDASAAVSRLENDIARRRRDIDTKTADITSLEAKLSKVEGDIASPDAHICVCCNQPLTGTDHLAEMIANLNDQADGIRKQIDRANSDRATFEGEIVTIGFEIEAAKAAAVEADTAAQEAIRVGEEAIDKLAALIASHEAVVADARKALADLGTAPQIMFGTRDELYVTKQAHDAIARDLEAEKAKVNPFDDQIVGFKDTMSVVSHEHLNYLTDLFKHQDFLLKMLTNKDSFIRKKIIDQNLNYLNGRLNGYLTELGLVHQVIFKPDLTIDITNVGREMDFEQLSRGEMNRVIMATSWAFRDVWESLNYPINLMFVDELIDNGLDSQGAEAALTVLKSFGRDRGKNMFLISHRDELVGRINRILTVSKANGFARIEETAN